MSAFDLKHLRTLVTIADSDSFVAAGERLGLTQSAVSLQVRQLEEQLHVKLFDRDRRPPVLTESGRRLVERARHVLELSEELWLEMSDDTLAGEISIGAVPTSLLGIVPAALVRLRAEQPALRISISSELSMELAEQIFRGALDAAVVTEPPLLEDGMVWRAFADEPVVVIAPPGTTEENDQELLENHPFIQFSRRTWIGHSIDQSLRKRRIKVDRVMEIDSLDAVLRMVESGLGVSVMPFVTRFSLESRGIRLLPFGEPQEVRRLGLLYRERNMKRRLIEVFYDSLLAQSE